MDHVKRVPQLLLFRSASFWVRHKQLDDGRRVNHSPIAFTKAAGSGSNGLLSDAKFVVQIPAMYQPGFVSSSGREVCLQLLVVHGLRYGPR